MAKAYFIFLRERIIDSAALQRYSADVGKSLDGQPIKFHVVYGAHQVLEGPPVEGVVVMEFPNTAAAKAWYESAAYQEVAKHRFTGAEYRAILVEGVDGD